MGSCRKGKSETDPHPGAYTCKKCGAVSEKEKHLCDAKKIKGADQDKDKDKKKKKK
ncbi:hypothetical protein [Geoalkalibacter sp.]|uniref:hypothetical protein n=1 Tax=Geoalkalibacter sp. TaxID=3041440 RepID=UPI00272ED240|nr:hypothetical protein [Geoalkalibacter sp.]